MRIIDKFGTVVLLVFTSAFLLNAQNDATSYARELTQASNFLKQGNYETALRSLQEAMRVDGASFEAYALQATVYNVMGKKQERQESMAKALDRVPDDKKEKLKQMSDAMSAADMDAYKKKLSQAFDKALSNAAEKNAPLEQQMLREQAHNERSLDGESGAIEARLHRRMDQINGEDRNLQEMKRQWDNIIGANSRGSGQNDNSSGNMGSPVQLKNGSAQPPTFPPAKSQSEAYRQAAALYRWQAQQFRQNGEMDKAAEAEKIAKQEDKEAENLRSGSPIGFDLRDTPRPNLPTHVDVIVPSKNSPAPTGTRMVASPAK